MASILTDVGEAKIASATPLDQVNITHIAVGDGSGGFPALDPSMTALTNETWRGNASAAIRDPSNENILLFEGVIPGNDGGYTIREAAIFDDDGDMIAIGHTSEIEKPDAGAEDGLTLTVRMHVALSSTSDVDLIYSDGGTIDHQGLTNRDAAECHPAEAISTGDLPDLPSSESDLWSLLQLFKSGALWQVMTQITDASTATEIGFYTIDQQDGPDNTPDDTQSAFMLVLRGGETGNVVFQIWMPANSTLSQNRKSIYYRSGNPPYNPIDWTTWTENLSDESIGIGAPVFDADDATLPGLHALPYALPSYTADNSPIPEVDGSILTIPVDEDGGRVVQVWFGEDDDGGSATQHIAFRFGEASFTDWVFLYQPGEFSLNGSVMAFATTVAPRGWLKCNGAAVSRTTYAALFSSIGTDYGSGDGSTTFNLPDLRGEFLRGFDDGRGVDSGRVFGSFQEGTEVGLVDGSYGNNLQGIQFSEGASGDTTTLNTSGGFTAGTDTFDYHGIRPRNLAIDFYIKY